jgi:hypothetical protein
MIVQHPNGNSYLFINNRVFVSAYNEASNSVITVELALNNLNAWEKEQVLKHIGNIFPDGFKYCVAVHSYGSHHRAPFDNYKEAQDYANEYYEENGFAHIFTNNPNIIDPSPLNGGEIYYLENIDLLEYPYHAPDSAKLLRASINSYHDEMMQEMYEAQRSEEEPTAEDYWDVDKSHTNFQ